MGQDHNTPQIEWFLYEAGPAMSEDTAAHIAVMNRIREAGTYVSCFNDALAREFNVQSYHYDENAGDGGSYVYVFNEAADVPEDWIALGKGHHPPVSNPFYQHYESSKMKVMQDMENMRALIENLAAYKKPECADGPDLKTKVRDGTLFLFVPYIDNEPVYDLPQGSIMPVAADYYEGKCAKDLDITGSEWHATWNTLKNAQGLNRN